MSSLQKNIMKSKLPPRCPRTSGISKLAPFGAARRKDYTPVSWKKYFEKYEDVETEAGVFRVYLSKAPEHPETPRIVTLHGGGYSGLSWALFTEEVTSMIHCQVVSMDVRGHGETQVKEPDDLNIDTLVNDVEAVLHKLFPNGLPPLLLVGHSMGGAVAVHAAHKPSLENALRGVAVIDVVEGTAMEALASMQSFLRGRPTHFKSIEHAIEWCVRSGQVRNVESAKVSMPSQIVNCETGQLATREVENYTPENTGSPEPFHWPPSKDSIAEEDETDDTDRSTHVAVEETDVFVKPSAAVGDCVNTMKYKWRIDLSRTEGHWQRWFTGLSNLFLSAPSPRLLLLANIEGLDTTLTLGQMQGPRPYNKFKDTRIQGNIEALDTMLTLGQILGKFQMQVLPRCGHAVHEDTPGEVARVISAFMLRHRLTTATEIGQQMDLVSVPGC